MSTQKLKYAIAGFASSSLFKGKSQALGAFVGSVSTSECIECQHEQITDKMVLENLPSHIATLDNNGYWKTVSPGYNAFFKSIADDNFTNWAVSTVHVQDRVAVLKAISDCRALMEEVSVEFRLLRQENFAEIPQWVELKCAPIEGSANTILTIFRDISDKKKLEAEIHKARDIADEANIAKTRFLANMSHELRTPLNAIIGFSEILKSGIVPDLAIEKRTEYQGLIYDSAQHLLHVLNDILDMSKMEAGKYEIFPEEFDLAQVISSSCSMMMLSAQNADVNLNVKPDAVPLLIEADSKAIRQIMINLISNAIKFSNPKTAIDIEAKRIGRAIEIKIRDRGCGISAECLDGLGKPFHQVDNLKSRQHEGTGLGLSIVKGLVELHNGEFEIESEKDVGTTVTVRLAKSMELSRPVPADEQDTIIRINPTPENLASKQAAISRLAG